VKRDTRSQAQRATEAAAAARQPKRHCYTCEGMNADFDWECVVCGHVCEEVPDFDIGD
jgi:rubrerythrin